MSDHTENHNENLDVLENLGYEQSDIDASPKVLTTHSAIFLGFIIFSFGMAWITLSVLDRADSFKFGRANTEVQRTPPDEAPLLQSNITAKKDMVDLRHKEEEKLNSYEEVEDHPGTYKIPVKKAMEIVAERGLPTSADASIPEDYQN